MTTGMNTITVMIIVAEILSRPWSMPMKILRAAEVVEMTGLSRVTLWRLERAQKFPARLRLSQKAVGWRDDEVLDWLQSLPRVPSDEKKPRIVV